jgi:hypothetical protein
LIRLTIPHWYGFVEGVREVRSGPLTESEWVTLRERDSAFGFGPTREAWIAAARSNAQLGERARAVAELLRGWNADRIVAVGAGTGSFEFLLKSFSPQLVIRCGDWGEETLALLKERFVEAASVERMDLRSTDWVRDPDEVVLLNRVDMEMSDEEWRAVFVRLAAKKVRRVLWIPCGLLTAGSLVVEVRGVAAGLVRRRRLFRSGYLRTPDRMVDLFAPAYERRELIRKGDQPTWGLHLKGSR